MAPALLCEAYSGARGTDFTRIWLVNFMSLLVGMTDDSGESIASNVQGLDEGSPGNPIPPVDPAAAAHIISRDQKRRAHYKTRCNKAFSLFYQHITDTGYRERLNAFVLDAAAQVPPVNARNGPVALACAIEWFAQPNNAIQLQAQNTEWTNLSLHVIGICDKTPRQMYARILTLNSERSPAQQFNQAGIATKFLSSFTFPEALMQRALDEMTNPVIGLHIADLMLRTNLIVTHFQSLWEAYFKQGAITPAPPRAAPSLQNHRVDGFECDTQDSNPAPHAPGRSKWSMDSDEYAYEAKFTSGPRSGEIICWKCFGSGHTSRSCPSAAIKRDRNEHMKRLAQSGQGNVQVTRTKKPPPRHRPPATGPRGRFATPPNKPKFSVRLVDAEPVSSEESGEEDFDECEEEFDECEQCDDEEIALTDIQSLFHLQCEPLVHAGSSCESDCLESESAPPATMSLDSILARIEGFTSIEQVHSVYALIALAREQKSLSLASNSAPEENRHALDSLEPTSAPAALSPLAVPENRAARDMYPPAPAELSAPAVSDTTTASALCMVFLASLLSLQLFLARNIGAAFRYATSVMRELAHGTHIIIVLLLVLATAASGLSAHIHSESLLSLQTNTPNHRREPSSFRVCPDTGASRSASPKKSLFPESGIQNRDPKMKVRVANGTHLKVVFIGTMILKLKCETTSSTKKFVVLPVKGSMFVPGLHTTLLSPRELYKLQSISTTFNAENCIVLPNGQKIEFTDSGSSYSLLAFDIDTAQVTKKQLDALDAWVISGDATSGAYALQDAPLQDKHAYSDLIHSRLLHVSYSRLLASKQYVKGVDFDKLVPSKVCAACKRADVRKPSTFQSSSRRYARFGERICSDACSLPVSTPFSFKGVIDFYDSATKLVAFYFLRDDTAKSVKSCFDQFIIDHKKYMPHGRVLEWYFDNHGQFTGGIIDDAMRALGTKLKTIAPWNPQQNPAERPWLSMLPALRKSLAACNLSENTWPFLLKQWERVSNALVTSSKSAAHLGASPYFMATCGHKSDLSLLRVIGCRVDCVVRSPYDHNLHLSKLSPRISGVHLGISTHQNGYLVYIPEWRRLTVYRFGDCYFHETIFPRVDYISGTMLVPGRGPLVLPSVSQQRAHARASPVVKPITDTSITPIASLHMGTDEIVSPLLEDSLHLLSVPGLDSTLPIERLAFSLSALMEPSKLPKTFTQVDALPDDQAKLWRDAGQKEYAAKMATNRSAVLVPRPPSANVLPTKVVFTHKLNMDGSICEYKCRWTACGNYQQESDISETFAATGRAASLRAFCVHCISNDLLIKQLDVTKAFTQFEVDRDIYVEQMDGYVQGDFLSDGRPNLVCFLEKGKGKALEGLCQSGFLFQKGNIGHLKELGFRQLETEPTIFVGSMKAGHVSIYVHIDDFLTGYANSAAVLEFETRYQREGRTPLPLKISPIGLYAGVLIKHNHGAGTIHLSQPHILERAAERFFGSGKSIVQASAPAHYDPKVPFGSTFALANDSEKLNMKEKPYLALLATIMYTVFYTFPSVAIHTAHLCRYMHSPNTSCWDALVHLFRYMYHHRHVGVTYRKNFPVPSIPCTPAWPDDPDIFLKNLGLHVWSDATWKVESTYAGFFIVMCGAAVDWAAVLIKVICHSSAEAEISAACKAGKRLMFVVQLMRELGHDLVSPTPFLIDNSATGELTKKMGATKRTEHFLRWQHYMRQLVNYNYAKVFLVRDQDQRADIATKVVNLTKFAVMVREITGNSEGPK